MTTFTLGLQKIINIWVSLTYKSIGKNILNISSESTFNNYLQNTQYITQSLSTCYLLKKIVKHSLLYPKYFTVGYIIAILKKKMYILPQISFLQVFCNTKLLKNNNNHIKRKHKDFSLHFKLFPALTIMKWSPPAGLWTKPIHTITCRIH